MKFIFFAAFSILPLAACGEREAAAPPPSTAALAPAPAAADSRDSSHMAFGEIAAAWSSDPPASVLHELPVQLADQPADYSPPAGQQHIQLPKLTEHQSGNEPRPNKFAMRQGDAPGLRPGDTVARMRPGDMK